MDCPEGNKERGAKPTMKIESVEQPIVESDQEASSYLPAPTIPIPIKIANAKTPALVDTGAAINTVSPRVAGRSKLPRLPIRPSIHIVQAFHPARAIVNKKISAKVTIPFKRWTSKKAVEFHVAPLVNSEAVLGMPFLKQERIKVDPTVHDILLPASKAPKTQDRPTSPANPAISLELATPPNPTRSPVYAQRYHEEAVNEFPELFADKLPPRSQRRINPDAPIHRIELKDPKKTINGRLFALPEKFLNSMIDFLEEHLLARHIRPSKSSFTAGTWMIPKKDHTAMPRIVHDYRALNENTIKDHTPLPRQDLIIRQLAKAKYRGKLDCPNSYYQMAMHPDDVHKTAFNTPFGLFQWLVMPQGLCNAPATWQRFMNWILRKHVGKICHIYIDDIAIFSDSLLEHHRNVRLVLQAL